MESKKIVGTGSTIDIINDPWIITTTLAMWPTFMNVDIPLEDLSVSSLITLTRKWDVVAMEGMFAQLMISFISSIPLLLKDMVDSHGPRLG